MKGYVYTIEVMLAVAAILVMIVFVFSSTPEQPETGLAIIKQRGYDALYFLDQNDELREAVALNESAYVLNNVSKLIPASISFAVGICTGECSSSELPANRTTVVVDYYVSGYKDEFIGKKVRLWMWERF